MDHVLTSSLMASQVFAPPCQLYSLITSHFVFIILCLLGLPIWLLVQILLCLLSMILRTSRTCYLLLTFHHLNSYTPILSLPLMIFMSPGHTYNIALPPTPGRLTYVFKRQGRRLNETVHCFKPTRLLICFIVIIHLGVL